jgi:hypothetical protein
MRKSFAGFFKEPSTGEIVAIMPRKGETPGAARIRVAAEFKLEADAISDKLPEGASDAGLVVDIPSRVPTPEAPVQRERDPREAVKSYEASLNPTVPAPGATVESMLLDEKDEAKRKQGKARSEPPTGDEPA